MRPFSPASFRGQVVLALVLCSPVAAQLPDLPTLAGAGVEHISPGGFFQISLSGQLDLEGTHISDEWEPAFAPADACTVCHTDIGRAIRQGDGGLRTQRLRLFADLFLGDHVYSLIELRADHGGEAYTKGMRGRVEQIYIRLSTASGAAGLQVGRFASPFGSYPIRHLSTEDPFLRAPLFYEYRTVANRWTVPVDARDFLAWKRIPEAADLPGSPPVWEVPYQAGAMLFGVVGPVDLRVALMNSAPSSGPPQWEFRGRDPDPVSWVVAARTQPSASLEIGASYGRGGWMEDPLFGSIQPLPGSPPGAEPPHWSDFDQEAVAVDIKVARGGTVLRAEAILDRWDVPNVSDRATELAYNIEAQHDLLAGLSVALRGGFIDFRPLDDGLGAASPLPDGREDWDFDVFRYEGSVAYRLARNWGILVNASQTRQSNAVDGDQTLVGARLWWAF